MSTSARDRARTVVLGVLVADVAVAGALAVGLVAPGGVGPWGVVAVVLAVHSVVHVLALRAAVSPWIEDRGRGLLAAALIAATAVAWPVLTASAVPDEEPWAWLAGFSVGALLVLRPWAGVGAALGGVLGVVAGPVVFGTGSVRDGLVFAAVSALASGGVTWLMVWMLAMLVRAEDGREAQARLAVAEERLRVSRDLHDVLGHRLAVLALRAELAGDLEAAELATRTLREVRETLHGYGTVDLHEQLRGAELVLGSAGIDVQVHNGAPTMSAPVSQLFAAAVREAVTNVLRHSDARCCRIELDGRGERVRLRVENDGVRAPAPTGGGVGLAGLGERAQLVGARVRTEATGDRYRLTVELAP